MKKHIVNWYTASPAGGAHMNPVGEVNNLPSKTIPGQTLGLAQLLERFARGENITTFQPVFSDDPDLPDGVENMSIFEKLDMSNAIKDGIEDFRKTPKPVKSDPPLDSALLPPE